MASGRYEIVKAKGSDPERFVRIWLDPEPPSGTFIKTSPEPGMSEAELRADLTKDGRNEAEIKSVIERARKNEA